MLRKTSQTQKDTLSCFLSSVDLRYYMIHPIYLISYDMKVEAGEGRELQRGKEEKGEAMRLRSSET